jgi:hypothetical protein
MKLQTFLYILLRDHLPFGEVEKIIADHIEAAAGLEMLFTEEKMAEYAASLAARLQEKRDW